MDTNEKDFKGTAPYFMVRNLQASLEFYHRALGFDMPDTWGDPPTFAMPSREGFTFMIKQAEPQVTITTSRDQGGFWDAYVWVNDADSLFVEFKENGATFDYEPCIQDEYDMKEFAVRDPDGHVIAFGSHHKP
jgi:uncharacterized glyoxalase superfamily protein PhnB